MVEAVPQGVAIEALIDVMARLRSKDSGCPWDLEQDFKSIAPYTIEEAYEVFDAIERQDMVALKDELGDLLLQVVYHARLAEELGLFDFDAVAAQSAAKMVRRHPHIFAADEMPRNAAQQTAAWETVKAAERSVAATDNSALAGVAPALPALTRAVKLQKRAARVGFDWTEPGEILAKIDEEIEELRVEIDAGSGVDRLEDELGDVLFTVANLARRLGLDPELALRRASEKFSMRFRRIEALSEAAGIAVQDQSAAALEALWREAKSDEASTRTEID